MKEESKWFHFYILKIYLTIISIKTIYPTKIKKKNYFDRALPSKNATHVLATRVQLLLRELSSCITRHRMHKLLRGIRKSLRREQIVEEIISRYPTDNNWRW